MLTNRSFFSVRTALTILMIVSGVFLFLSAKAQTEEGTSTPPIGEGLLDFVEGSTCTGTLLTNYDDTTDGDYALYSDPLDGNIKLAQSFSFATNTAYEINCIRVVGYRTASYPANLTLGLYNTASHYPDGAALGEVSGIDVSGWTTSDSGNWEAINFTSNIEVASGTEYAIQLTCPDCEIDNLIRWLYKSTGSYADGQLGKYVSSWSTDGDFMFEIYGTEIEAEATSSATSTSDINDPTAYPAIFFYMILLFLISFYIVTKI